MAESSSDKKKMPKGGRKGGKIFPQYSLGDVVIWSNKLVSKSHSGPQPDDVVRASVVSAKSGVANMRISALKQFDLMEGSAAGYSSTPLAKKIRSAPEGESTDYLKEAALSPDIFKKLYETFHGDDDVSLARLRQRAADLGVHPDSTEKCAEIYAQSIVSAGLAQRNGDVVAHDEIALKPSEADTQDLADDPHEEEGGAGEEVSGESESSSIVQSQKLGRGNVQIAISVDSSLDTDKLEKQLALLKKFGVI